MIKRVSYRNVSQAPGHNYLSICLDSLIVSLIILTVLAMLTPYMLFAGWLQAIVTIWQEWNIYLWNEIMMAFGFKIEHTMCSIMTIALLTLTLQLKNNDAKHLSILPILLLFVIGMLFSAYPNLIGGFNYETMLADGQSYLIWLILFLICVPLAAAFISTRVVGTFVCVGQAVMMLLVINYISLNIY